MKEMETGDPSFNTPNLHINQDNSKHINNNINTTNNTIIIGGQLSEIENLLNGKMSAHRSQSIVNLLKNWNLKKNVDVIDYVNEYTPSIEEVRACFDQIMINDQDEQLNQQLLQILINTFNRPPTDCLHILFRRVFVHVHKGHIQITSLQRRILRKDSHENKLKVLGFVKKLDDDDELNRKWVDRHWRNTIEDLLYSFGSRLYHTYQNQESIPDKSHPFIVWWNTITCSDLISIDRLGIELIKRISEDLIEDCQNDLVKGWHLLVDCYSAQDSLKAILNDDYYRQRNGTLKTVLTHHLQ